MLVTEFKCKSRPQVPSECAIVDICVERTLSTVRPEAGVNLVENGDIVGDNPPLGSFEGNLRREPIARPFCKVPFGDTLSLRGSSEEPLLHAKSVG
jgi:hypothetical protein